MTNHIATNLVTKGLLNMSNITKGMIIIGYKIIVKVKKGGGAQYGLPYGEYEPIFKEYKDPEKFYKDLKEIEDIDYIEVQIQWKESDSNKKIEVQLIQKKIEAIIFENTGKKIKVEIIE